MVRGWGPTHLRGLRKDVRARSDLLAEALTTHAPQAHLDHLPAGGLNLWVRLPEATDVVRLVRDTESDGQLIAPGAEWFPAEPTGPYVRLNYSVEDPSRFQDATRILGSALARQA